MLLAAATVVHVTMQHAVLFFFAGLFEHWYHDPMIVTASDGFVVPTMMAVEQ